MGVCSTKETTRLRKVHPLEMPIWSWGVRGNVHMGMSTEAMGVHRISRKERKKRGQETKSQDLLLLEK